MDIKKLEGKKCFQLHSLDVWGNAKDGYDVNQMYPVGFFFITDEVIPTFDAIVHALKNNNILKKRFHFTSQYPYENEEVIEYKRKPIYDVREVDLPDFFGRWFTTFPRTRDAIVLKEDKNGNLRRINVC